MILRGELLCKLDYCVYSTPVNAHGCSCCEDDTSLIEVNPVLSSAGFTPEALTITVGRM